MLLALAHARHPHFEQASRWIGGIPQNDSICFCRFTQLGLLRLLTTQSAMGDDVLTQAAAWRVYDRFFEDARFVFLIEPADLDPELRRRTTRAETSPKRWADAYLAAFAQAANVRLVTFDRALSRQISGSVLLGV